MVKHTLRSTKRVRKNQLGKTKKGGGKRGKNKRSMKAEKTRGKPYIIIKGGNTAHYTDQIINEESFKKITKLSKKDLLNGFGENPNENSWFESFRQYSFEGYNPKQARELVINEMKLYGSNLSKARIEYWKKAKVEIEKEISKNIGTQYHGEIPNYGDQINFIIKEIDAEIKGREKDRGRYDATPPKYVWAKIHPQVVEVLKKNLEYFEEVKQIYYFRTPYDVAFREDFKTDGELKNLYDDTVTGKPAQIKIEDHLYNYLFKKTVYDELPEFMKIHYDHLMDQREVDKKDVDAPEVDEMDVDDVDDDDDL